MDCPKTLLLFLTQSELEQRNLIQQSRVVVIPSDSQSVCVNRPDVGTFDTLIMTSTVPTDLNIRIENNCVKITAHPTPRLIRTI